MLTDELAYWGQGSLQTKLDEAYKDFVGYCRVHKLPHSQPPFKVKMDSLKHLNSYQIFTTTSMQIEASL